MKRPSLLAAALFFTAAAPAHAADLSVTPSTTQAGAHASVVISASFAQDPSRVALHFPPGLVGNPNAAAKCPIATFENGACPASSRVGSVVATTRLLVSTPGDVY